jgi:hypothetical protein
MIEQEIQWFPVISGGRWNMRAPGGLMALVSGIGKRSLVVGITGNSIILFEKALTSFFRWFGQPLSGHYTK